MPKSHQQKEVEIRKEVPTYTLFDIQIGVSGKEFAKGISLYKSGKVLDVKNDGYYLQATVKGTHMYHVSVSHKNFEKGMCDCYLGENDYFCKHIIAVAIAGVYKYRPDDADTIDYPLDQAVCRGEVCKITKSEMMEAKMGINQAMRYIKSYDGSSSTWFDYQAKLEKGARLILYTLSKIPVCKKSADICIDLVVRLDKKMAYGGIDDSDGVVGDLVEEILELLSMFMDEDKTLKEYIVAKFPKETNFDWMLHMQSASDSLFSYSHNKNTPQK